MSARRWVIVVQERYETYVQLFVDEVAAREWARACAQHHTTLLCELVEELDPVRIRVAGSEDQ